MKYLLIIFALALTGCQSNIKFKVYADFSKVVIVPDYPTFTDVKMGPVTIAVSGYRPVTLSDFSETFPAVIEFTNPPKTDTLRIEIMHGEHKTVKTVIIDNNSKWYSEGWTFTNIRKINEK